MVEGKVVVCKVVFPSILVQVVVAPFVAPLVIPFS